AVLRVALPPGQYLPAAVALDAEVRRAALRLRVEPHGPAAVVHDQRPLGLDLLRRNEDVAAPDLLASDVDRHHGGRQVGPRDEVQQLRISRPPIIAAVHGGSDGEADDDEGKNFSQRLLSGATARGVPAPPGLLFVRAYVSSGGPLTDERVWTGLDPRGRIP